MELKVKFVGQCSESVLDDNSQPVLVAVKSTVFFCPAHSNLPGPPFSTDTSVTTLVPDLEKLRKSGESNFIRTARYCRSFH